MKTLKEHNNDMLEQYGLRGPEWSLIEVACDACNKEIQVQTSVILTSHPPKQKVRCSNPQCQDYRKIKYMVI